MLAHEAQSLAGGNRSHASHVRSCVFFAEQVNKLLRVTRIWKSKPGRSVQTNTTWKRIILDFFNVTMIAHWAACLWWGIGDLEYKCVEERFAEYRDVFVNTSMDPHILVELPETSYLVLDHMLPTSHAVRYAVDSCGGGVPWVVRTDTKNLTSAPLMQKWLTSLYFSVSTIVRNPSISPDTIYEQWYTGAVIVIGTIIFAVIVGNVNAMIRSYDERSSTRRRRFAEMRLFIDFHGLPPGMQDRMLQYAAGDWKMNGGLDTQETLGGLPYALRSAVLMRIFEGLRSECGLFRGLPSECVRLLISQIQPQLCLRSEAVIEPGQLLWELFFLRRGSLSIKRGNSEWLLHQATASAWKTKQMTPKHRRGGALESLFRVLDKPGQYVGLVHPFEAPPRSPFRVTAIKQCQLLRITQSKVWSVLSNFEARVQAKFCRDLSDHYNSILASLKLPAYGGDGGGGGMGEAEDLAGRNSVDNLGLTSEQRAQLLMLDDDDEDPEDGYGDAPGSCQDRVKRGSFGDITFAARKSRADGGDNRRKSRFDRWGTAPSAARSSMADGMARASEQRYSERYSERYSSIASIASVPDCGNRMSQRGSTSSMPGERMSQRLCSVQSACGDPDSAAMQVLRASMRQSSRTGSPGTLRSSQHRGSDATSESFGNRRSQQRSLVLPGGISAEEALQGRNEMRESSRSSCRASLMNDRASKKLSVAGFSWSEDQKQADVRAASLRIQDLAKTLQSCEDRCKNLSAIAATMPELANTLNQVVSSLTAVKLPRLPRDVHAKVSDMLEVSAADLTEDSVVPPDYLDRGVAVAHLPPDFSPLKRPSEAIEMYDKPQDIDGPASSPSPSPMNGNGSGGNKRSILNNIMRLGGPPREASRRRAADGSANETADAAAHDGSASLAHLQAPADLNGSDVRFDPVVNPLAA